MAVEVHRAHLTRLDGIDFEDVAINGPVRAPSWAMAEADREWSLELASWPSLEAQVAAVADDIAYDNHDIDDGLRAGLIDFEALLEEPLVAESWRRVVARYPGVERARLLPELVREQIGRMVEDVLAETQRRLERVRPDGEVDVRAAGEALIGFSPEMDAAERSLKTFMYARFYHHPAQRAVAERAGHIVTGLVSAYRQDPRLLPEGWHERLPADDPGSGRHVADFIAGMTDRYAIARFRQVVGPIDMPEGF